MFFDSLIHARDVLLDVVLRQIYDTDGEKGLEEYVLAQERAELDQTSFEDDFDRNVGRMLGENCKDASEKLGTSGGGVEA